MSAPTLASFRHEAVFYDGAPGFTSLATDFVEQGLDADDVVLIATSADKIATLQDTLGRRANDVEFADMATLGRNPSRIIPRWRTVVERGQRAGRGVRGIGEPVWPGRTADELDECHRHEALLNLAFQAERFLLVCPYDVSTLDAAVTDAARRTHPVTTHAGHTAHRSSPMMFDMGDALSPAPKDHLSTEFDASQLQEVRQIVQAAATASGLDKARTADLVLAANELAANSVLHGGGRGTLRVWSDAEGLVVEVTDAGRISDPLIGRVAPAPEAATGRGLWIVNQVCDLVQLRSDDRRTVVRVRMHAG